jgi:hypothetical protein
LVIVRISGAKPLDSPCHTKSPSFTIPLCFSLSLSLAHQYQYQYYTFLYELLAIHLSTMQQQQQQSSSPNTEGKYHCRHLLCTKGKIEHPFITRGGRSKHERKREAHPCPPDRCSRCTTRRAPAREPIQCPHESCTYQALAQNCITRHQRATTHACPPTCATCKFEQQECVMMFERCSAIAAASGIGISSVAAAAASSVNGAIASNLSHFQNPDNSSSVAANVAAAALAAPSSRYERDNDKFRHSSSSIQRYDDSDALGSLAALTTAAAHYQELCLPSPKSVSSSSSSSSPPPPPATTLSTTPPSTAQQHQRHDAYQSHSLERKRSLPALGRRKHDSSSFDQPSTPPSLRFRTTASSPSLPVYPADTVEIDHKRSHSNHSYSSHNQYSFAPQHRSSVSVKSEPRASSNQVFSPNSLSSVATVAAVAAAAAAADASLHADHAKQSASDTLRRTTSFSPPPNVNGELPPFTAPSSPDTCNKLVPILPPILGTKRPFASTSPSSVDSCQSSSSSSSCASTTYDYDALPSSKLQRLTPSRGDESPFNLSRLHRSLLNSDFPLYIDNERLSASSSSATAPYRLPFVDQARPSTYRDDGRSKLPSISPTHQQPSSLTTGPSTRPNSSTCYLSYLG